MNKEQLVHVQGLHARAQKTRNAIRNLSGTANDIQYQRFGAIPVVLKALGAMHEREQNAAKKACEEEKRNHANNAHNKPSFNPPKSFGERINETAHRIKSKSLPNLARLKDELEAHILEDITIQIYLKMQRTTSGVQFKDISASYDPPLPISSVFGMENIREAARKKDVEAYRKAGVPIDDDFVAKIRKSELAQAENIGAFFRNERLFQGIEIRQIAQAFSYQRVTLSEMERGLKPVSKRARKGYEQVLGIKAPKRLLEKQEREKKERFTRARTSNALRLIESESPVPETIGDFLRRARLQAGKSLTNLAGLLGRTERNFSLVETDAITVSDAILDVYVNELGIEIPQELLEQNKRRKDLIRQRLIAERKSRRITKREPGEKLQ